jgi:multidrug resistance protein
MTKHSKNLLIVALAMVMFLAAVEGTVVTLAIPTIVRDLAGFDLISWVFSVYLLASAVSIPIFGKLCDLFGRKKIMIIGILIFITGSALCGLSQNMEMLIIFRVIQGIGSGAIFTVPLTIVGDVFPLNERGKIQGAMSMVWGIAGLFGPFIGGAMIALLSWHWIFFINVPTGLVTVAVLQRVFREEFQRRKQPIIPRGIFTVYSNVINIISFLSAAALIGIDVYLPIYLQNVKGLSPLLCGLLLLPMSISWMIASTISGKLIVRFGFKKVTVFYLLVGLVCTFPILLFTSSGSLVLVGVVIFLVGFGIGGTFAVTAMAIQESVGFEKRGMAVSVNSLLKTGGQTVGITSLGILFNMAIIQGFSGAGVINYNLSDIYNLAAYQADVTWEQIVAVLDSSLQYLYWAIIAISALALIFAIFMPSSQRLSPHNKDYDGERRDGDSRHER